MTHIETIDQKLRKKQYFSLSQMIIVDSELKEAFAEYYLRAELRTIQAMSHVLDKAKKKNYYLLDTIHDELVHRLEKSENNSFKRVTYRYFSDTPIDEELSGTLYDMGMNTMGTLEEQIAIRVFAMTTCVNIAKGYPELFPELKDAIELCSRDESPAIKARCRRHLVEIDKWSK